METKELERKLKERGYGIRESFISQDGVLRLLINDVWVSRPDAVDLATGKAQLDDIIRRNENQKPESHPSSEG